MTEHGSVRARPETCGSTAHRLQASLRRPPRASQHDHRTRGKPGATAV